MSKSQISKNQYDFLNNLVKDGGGKGEWAKVQLAQSVYTPSTPVSNPAPANPVSSNQSVIGSLANHSSNPYRSSLEQQAAKLPAGAPVNPSLLPNTSSGGLSPNNYTQTQQPANPQQQYFEELRNQLNSTLASMQKQQADAAKLAEQQAIAGYNSQFSAYQNLVNSLKTGQQNDLAAIQGSIEGAKNNIEDRSFQDWLSARQNVASRGLSGSGIAGDADTRLLLARQRGLTDMYNQKTIAINDVNKRYSDQINKAQTQLAGLNLPNMQADAFAKLFQGGQTNLIEQAKIYQALLKEQMGYAQTNTSDALKYGQKQYETNTKYQYLYDKLNTDARNKAADLAFKYDQLGLDYTKIMGVDANGNLTLDSREFMADMEMRQKQLNEQIRHNKASEGQGWASIEMSKNNLAARLREIQLNATKFETDAARYNLNVKGDTFNKIIDVESKHLLSIKDSLDKNPKNEKLLAEYDKTVNRLDAAMAGLGGLSGVNLGGYSSSSSSAAPRDPAEPQSVSEGFSSGVSNVVNNAVAPFLAATSRLFMPSTLYK